MEGFERILFLISHTYHAVDNEDKGDEREANLDSDG